MPKLLPMTQEEMTAAQEKDFIVPFGRIGRVHLKWLQKALIGKQIARVEIGERGYGEVPYVAFVITTEDGEKVALCSPSTVEKDLPAVSHW